MPNGGEQMGFIPYTIYFDLVWHWKMKGTQRCPNSKNIKNIPLDGPMCLKQDNIQIKINACSQLCHILYIADYFLISPLAHNLFKLQHWTLNSWAIEFIKLNYCKWLSMWVTATLTKLTRDPFSNNVERKASLSNYLNLILHHNSSHLIFI